MNILEEVLRHDGCSVLHSIVASKPSEGAMVYQRAGKDLPKMALALNNYGISHKEGFVGTTVEETIRNLGRVGMVGLSRADGTMLDIMIEKTVRA